MAETLLHYCGASWEWLHNVHCLCSCGRKSRASGLPQTHMVCDQLCGPPTDAGAGIHPPAEIDFCANFDGPGKSNTVSSCTPACRREVQSGRAALREAQQVQTAGRPAAVPLDALKRSLQLLQGGRQAAGAALCRFAVWAPLHRRQVILWHGAPVYINAAGKTRPGLDCIAHSWNENEAPRTVISERLHVAHAARISRSSRAATGDQQD